MNAGSLVNHFILVQACLLLFYLLWRLSAWFENAVTLRAGARRWVVLGRVLVLASLASPLLCVGLERAPLAARWLPETPLAGRILVEIDVPDEPAARTTAAAAPSAATAHAPAQTGLATPLAAIWAIGVLVILSLRIVQWLRLRAFLADTVTLRRHGRVEIVVHPERVSPVAARMSGRAIVLVPAFLLESGRWRDAARHELVHLRRGDTRWALAWDVLTALLWANPAIWPWRRRMTEMQELACDEQLLERGRVNPKAYGCTLLDVAEALSSRRTPRLAACTSMAERGWIVRSLLSRRLDRIMSHSQLRRSDMKRVTVWTLAALGLWAAMAAAWAAGVAPTSPVVPETLAQAKLQQLVSERLSAQVERCSARRGVAVVMDPATGAVLAAAGVRRHGSDGALVADDASPFTAPFLGASTAKTLVVAGSLQEGVVNPADVLDAGGGTLIVDRQTYREWKEGGLGPLTPADVIVTSSNLGAIMVAQRLGAERVAGFFGRLGYRVDGIGPIGDISCGNHATVSATAQQLAYAYAILVNGGRDPKGGEAVIRPEVSEFIRKALVRAVDEGTGILARCEGIVVGGKTGTSYRDGDDTRTGTAYFVGFAPAERPRIVVAVVLDGIGKEVNGGRHAAPLFREIAESGLPLLETSAAPSR